MEPWDRPPWRRSGFLWNGHPVLVLFGHRAHREGGRAGCCRRGRPMAEHKKNARPSSRPKHEKGQTRKRRDASGGEKKERHKGWKRRQKRRSEKKPNGE